MTDRTGPAMEARGLYHIYREADVETIALRGAGLTLEPGTWTSVMGPRGAAKARSSTCWPGSSSPAEER